MLLQKKGQTSVLLCPLTSQKQTITGIYLDFDAPPLDEEVKSTSRPATPSLKQTPSVAPGVVFLKDRLIFYNIIGEKWGARQLQGGDWWE